MNSTDKRQSNSQAIEKEVLRVSEFYTNIYFGSIYCPSESYIDLTKHIKKFLLDRIKYE